MTKTADGIDIFLSYAREDRGVAASIAEQLEARGRTVWWDWNLIGGQDFRAEIRRNLEQARHVVVLWSRDSVGSHFVIDEARVAKEAGKLIPVSLGPVEPPLGFGSFHAIAWRGRQEDVDRVVAALEGRALPVTFSGVGRRRLLTGGAVMLGAGALGIGATSLWNAIERAKNSGPPVPRLALVIGNNDYQSVPSLFNAINDTDALTGALKASGFHVANLPNATRAQTMEAIREFKTLLSLGGIGLFYYAGHAAHISGRDFVLPVDAPGLNVPDDIARHGIDISEVRAPIRSFFAALPTSLRTAGVCFGTVDDCLEVPPVANDADRSPDDPATIVRRAQVSLTQEDHGVLTIYSADQGEVAFDGTDGHSPFAQALLRELPAGDGDAYAMAKRVRARVVEATDALQHPVLEDRSHVNFHFNRPEWDPRTGVLRLVFLDSCRDNPFRYSSALGR